MKMNLDNTTLWTAIVTPMHANGDIDFDSFSYLLKRQNDAGCGILVLGSTGEALALSANEQRQVVDFVAQEALQVPLMVGVGGFRLEDQLNWLDYCNQYEQINAYLMVTPLYAKPGPLGQATWFNQLLDHSSKPCMLYNVPSRTGVNFSYEALNSLCGHQKFWALKEASGDIERFAHYVKLAPEVKVFSGEDALMPELAQVGAKGLVSVVSNIWPNETKRYVELALKHEIDKPTHTLWQRATSACFSVSNPIPTKVWLAKQNIIRTNTLRMPLMANELSNTDLLEDINSSIHLWHTKEIEGAI
ncbi:4-hydroxy-tetrahydrodipicolinate synthase [Thiotrichales bacterium 19S9-12]|nr:4-hydroxy-tetrahydrodipicolinate synthase [Thiotrichales bacterium 19S9-11]MCF6812310.1 4-hydroxy-tetrahydrodipicolinate synthase [Thiotrichales bacterium 19S9-12]